MLFVGEAEPGPLGVVGDLAFPEAFGRNAPICPDRRSLKELRLSSRIFEHRCSYIIHSAAFAALPDKIRDLVHAGLRRVFLDNAGGNTYAHIGTRERERVAAILDATHPGWR